MRRPYHSKPPKNITTIHKHDTQALARVLSRNGQALLPMVGLIEQSKLAVDELIGVLGRASIEAVLPAVAGRRKGSPGRRRVPDDGEEFSEDPRIPRSMDAQSGVASQCGSRPAGAANSSDFDGAGGLKCVTPPPTSNGISHTLLCLASGLAKPSGP